MRLFSVPFVMLVDQPGFLIGLTVKTVGAGTHHELDERVVAGHGSAYLHHA